MDAHPPSQDSPAVQVGNSGKEMVKGWGKVSVGTVQTESERSVEFEPSVLNAVAVDCEKTENKGKKTKNDDDDFPWGCQEMDG